MPASGRANACGQAPSAVDAAPPAEPRRWSLTDLVKAIPRRMAEAHERRRAERQARALATLTPESLDVLIDIVNQCNLRCIMCHFARDDVFYRRSQVMSPALFDAIAAKVRPYTRTLTLSAAYEPTVSPHFAEILRISARHGFEDIRFLTNGHHLPAHVAETIVSCGVHEVCISVHAAQPDTYARIMAGGRLDRALDNVVRLKQIRDAARCHYPRLQFNVALMRQNVAELVGIIELAARLGIDSVAFRHLIVFDGLGMERESLAQYDKRLANLHIQRALERAAALDVTVRNSPDYFDVDGPEARTQFVDWAAPGPRPPSAPVAPSERRTPVGLDRRPKALIGNIDVPAEGSFWHGGVTEVSGWALGLDGVRAVHLMRDPLPEDSRHSIGADGLIDLGTARFHNSTRADVMHAHPDWPYGFRAGWSFALARSSVPRTSRRHLVIRAMAVDRDGRTAEIGVRTVRLRRGRVDTRAIGCQKPFDSLYIDAHGQAYPYPDCHTSQPFGSLLRQSLEEIWHGSRLMALRRDLVAGHRPDMCERCPLFINRAVDRGQFFEPHADFSTEARR